MLYGSILAFVFESISSASPLRFSPFLSLTPVIMMFFIFGSDFNSLSLLVQSQDFGTC